MHDHDAETGLLLWVLGGIGFIHALVLIAVLFFPSVLGVSRGVVFPEAITGSLSGLPLAAVFWTTGGLLGGGLVVRTFFRTGSLGGSFVSSFAISTLAMLAGLVLSALGSNGIPQHAHAHAPLIYTLAALATFALTAFLLMLLREIITTAMR